MFANINNVFNAPFNSVNASRSNNNEIALILHVQYERVPVVHDQVSQLQLLWAKRRVSKILSVQAHCTARDSSRFSAANKRLFIACNDATTYYVYYTYAVGRRSIAAREGLPVIKWVQFPAGVRLIDVFG